MINKFVVDEKYRRQDVKKIAGVTDYGKKGGIWDTGYAKYNGAYYIFSNMSDAGRTGHDYKNKIVDDLFYWHLKGNHNFNTKTGKSLISGEYPVYLFVRYSNKDLFFTFLGYGTMFDYSGDNESWIVWRINTSFDKERAKQRKKFVEGKKIQRFINCYERDIRARQACLDAFGYTCIVCNFDFEKKYGHLGRKYIHVHHLKELSMLGNDYIVDPIEDLRPVCPNCHAMLHKSKPAYTIEQLKALIFQQTV